MANLKLSEIGIFLTHLSSILSADSNEVRIKLNSKNQSIEFLAHDKEKDLEIHAEFENMMNINKTIYFAIELPRLRLLFGKRSTIDVTLGNNVLLYSFGKTKGSIEILNSGRFSSPQLQETKSLLPSVMFKNLQWAKLTPVFSDKEIMLFINYEDNKNRLQLCCADNFHVSFVNILNARLNMNNFNYAIPLKYLYIADKLSNKDKVNLIIKENNLYFCTRNIILRMPKISDELSNVTWENANEHFSFLNKDLKRYFTVKTETIKNFMDSALAIKETDKTAEMRFIISKGILLNSIETKHGLITQKTEIDYDGKKEDLMFNCTVLNDLFKRDLGETVDMSIIGNNLLMKCKTIKDNNVSVDRQYTTIGTAHERD
jgi:hypothetical protein